MQFIYDLRFAKFPRLRANMAKFAVLLAYSFIHRKRMKNGLNEPREDFLGTRALLPWIFGRANALENLGTGFNA